MQHLRPTSLAWYALVLPLSLLLLWGAGYTEAQSARRQEMPSASAVSVTVIQVNPMAIPIYNEYTGTTDATGTAEVRTHVDGYIEQQLFDTGQLVKAKQLLYVLDQRLSNAELQKTKAAVAKAEAELRFAREKEGVEVLHAESRLTQSRAPLVKADQDVAHYLRTGHSHGVPRSLGRPGGLS